jgi:glycosyltransferase involved in cell wall biosynthesis
VLLDLSPLGVNRKGLARVLTALTPRLVALEPGRYRAVTTRAGLPVLEGLGVDLPVTVAPRVPNAVWEQVVLPGVATALRATSIYCHQECGALWGPGLVLHVPEDPEIRWSREPTAALRERSRRRYSRMFMNPSLRRATIVTSTASTRGDLQRRHGIDPSVVEVVPLGVDLDVFAPSPPTDGGGEGGEQYFFHLASSDARDRTDVILEGFSLFLSDQPGRARLIIGGELGERADSLVRQAGALGIGHSVTFTGRIGDHQLTTYYAGAIAAVQASPDEGFGLQPLEAMACGALLISTPASAVAEVTEGAVVLWSEATAQAMATAMGMACDRPELADRARTINRTCAEAYSWDRCAGVLHDLLIDAHPRSRTRSARVGTGGVRTG